MKETLQKFREDLHQIPEIFFQEFKTKAYLKKALEDMGYEPKDVLETGLYVYIKGRQREAVAFRSDIDALEIKEETNVAFESKHKGFMHACGHDGHMAMLLGFADYLKDKKASLEKSVLLLFQPAEESIGGAKKIVETGLFKTYNVESIFGIHLYPGLDEGVIGSKANEFMAMANEIDITVTGKSAHGAMPHLGIDANMILAKMLVEFENIQTRLLSPMEYSIITFGKISGGDVRNILSETAKMEGTIRSFNLETKEAIIKSIKGIAKGFETMYGCSIDVSISEGYLPVVNDETLYNKFKEAVKSFPYHEFNKPLMIAEDFSFYQQAVKGVFFYVGTKNETLNMIHSLHSSKFNFTVNALVRGVEAYITISKKLGVIHG